MTRQPDAFFSTSRLRAERLAPRHLRDLTDLHLDPEVSRYLGGVRSPAETKEYLDVNLAHWDRHGFGLWVFRTAEGSFAARAGLRCTQIDGVPEIEIAYTVHRNLWGRGLATEIAHALVTIWRDAELTASLVGIASLGNEPSRRILERVGLTYERDTSYHDAEVAVYRAVY